MNEEPLITLDVREEIRNGREPFSKVMEAAAQLTAGQEMRLLAPFEPVPLFHVLAKLGFTHVAQPVASGDWEVRFRRNPGEATTQAGNHGVAESAGVKPTCVLELDVRGLEPPQPLVTILEAVASLSDGAELRAHTDRRPMHLYALLEDRGCHAESEESNDGSFITHIRRRS